MGWHDTRMTAVAPHARLFVALVWDTLDLPSSRLLEVDSALTKILREKYGTEWDAELYRTFVSDQNKEFLNRLTRYRSEGKIRRWRRPRHIGRRAPGNWDATIRKQLSDWCIHEPAAKEATTTAVLVTNRGRFNSTFRELAAAGVQILIVGTKQLDRAFAMQAERASIKMLYLENWEDEKKRTVPNSHRT